VILSKNSEIKECITQVVSNQMWVNFNRVLSWTPKNIETNRLKMDDAYSDRIHARPDYFLRVTLQNLNLGVVLRTSSNKEPVQVRKP